MWKSESTSLFNSVSRVDNPVDIVWINSDLSTVSTMKKTIQSYPQIIHSLSTGLSTYLFAHYFAFKFDQKSL